MSNIILPVGMNPKAAANDGVAAITAPYLDAQQTKYEKGNPIALQKLCTDCAVILQNEYNGNGHFAWGCAPTPDGSMINIRLYADGLHGRYGWQIKTTDLQQETGRRKALIFAGGEILERYNIEGKKQAAESKRLRDTRGEVIPEL